MSSAAQRDDRAQGRRMRTCQRPSSQSHCTWARTRAAYDTRSRVVAVAPCPVQPGRHRALVQPEGGDDTNVSIATVRYKTALALEQN